MDERIKNPGAGSYDPTDFFIKPKPPAFTISTRYEAPRDTSAKPGPGEYAPEKVSISVSYLNLTCFCYHCRSFCISNLVLSVPLVSIIHHTLEAPILSYRQNIY